jgi:hypothetical protein
MRVPTGRSDSPTDLQAARQMLCMLQRGEDQRAPKIDRVRAVLSSGGYEGAYDTELALDIVTERVLDELMP